MRRWWMRNSDTVGQKAAKAEMRGGPPVAEERRCKRMRRTRGVSWGREATWRQTRDDDSMAAAGRRVTRWDGEVALRAAALGTTAVDEMRGVWRWWMRWMR